MIPAHIRNDDNIFVGNPPLTVMQGMDRMRRIEARDVTVLNGLQGDALTLQYYNADPNRIFSQEWGLGRDRTAIDGEVVIIGGGQQGVPWGQYLAHLVPLAHSHPYFLGNAAATRAITGGGIPFDSINGVAVPQDFAERLKVFPSAGDLAFCVGQELAIHTVFTPYVVVRHPAGGIWIANHDANPGFAGAPRLKFLITNVVEPMPNRFRFTLAAYEGNVAIWRRRNVTANANNGLQSGVAF
jgi:hypothetical protein